MDGEPPAHELPQRLEIALVAEVLLGVGVVAVLGAFRLIVLLRRLDHAAEPGADGVDEDQVGERQPGLLVRHEPGGMRGSEPSTGKRDPRRADGAHVQERRRGPRAAVEHEGHRPVEVVAVAT